jgi:hypothetical protein
LYLMLQSGDISCFHLFPLLRWNLFYEFATFWT